MRQTSQSSEKEMSCHTAGITHAARHRSLYSSVDLKWICTSQMTAGCLELLYQWYRAIFSTEQVFPV
jgi:hypothetical protein